jgi:hypothetical protein
MSLRSPRGRTADDLRELMADRFSRAAILCRGCQEQTAPRVTRAVPVAGGPNWITSMPRSCGYPSCEGDALTIIRKLQHDYDLT